MKQIISVLTENRAGVLSRIAGMFSRRGYNIDSLAVGETEDSSISRFTIVTDADEEMLEQILKQLNKMIDTIKVRSLTNEPATIRELLLIKVSADDSNRGVIMDLAATAGAVVVDVSPQTLTLQLCSTPEKTENLRLLCVKYGIKEIVRTGITAMQKGSDVLHK
ncbi:MAG: acetolactate synthase small subunit [Ruminococcus sp.]|nr:acetolactate synthase small subunit [Ruminococcus sp.]